MNILSHIKGLGMYSIYCNNQKEKKIIKNINFIPNYVLDAILLKNKFEILL